MKIPPHKYHIIGFIIDYVLKMQLTGGRNSSRSINAIFAIFPSVFELWTGTMHKDLEKNIRFARK